MYKAYISKDQKEAVICLAGCVGFCQTLMRSEIPVYKNMQDKLQSVVESAQAVMDELMQECDQDQVAGVLRYAENSQLTVVPKYSEVGKKDLYVVECASLERLLSDCLTDCTFCEKDAKQIKKCQRRKDLLACGMMNKGEECPFKV